MARATARRTAETLKYALDGLREILGPDPAAAPILHTLTTYGRGESDWVRVYVIGSGNSAGRILNLTWHLAVILDAANVPDKGVRYGGIQYNKALEAAETLWRAAYGDGVPFDQLHWDEIR